MPKSKDVMLLTHKVFVLQPHIVDICSFITSVVEEFISQEDELTGIETPFWKTLFSI